MALTLKLESFDDHLDKAPQLHPEYVRGMEEGAKKGHSIAQDERQLLNAELVNFITETQFTFAEARQSILAELAPLLAAITNRILPATQTIGLASMICEILQDAANTQLSAQPIITVHPDQIDAVTTALSNFLPSKITVVPDASLTPHAACLSLNNRESMVDFENTFAAVQTALSAYTNSPERNINHG